MTVLLDANVLIALTISDHDHHEIARPWFATLRDSFATCPITQGALVRALFREGHNAGTVQALLSELTQDGRHVFWPDRIGFHEVRLDSITGHRQVTDAYLAQLTRAHNGRLATFDEGLAGMHPDVTDLIPTG